MYPDYRGLDPYELNMDLFTNSWQTTVRVTHLPTGISAEVTSQGPGKAPQYKVKQAAIDWLVEKMRTALPQSAGK